MKRFVDALLVEANGRAEILRKESGREFNTVYFGGGTPSMLSSTHLTRLVEGLYSVVSRDSIDEFSFEANPATFNERKAALWAGLGITRVSLGVQSWDAATLKLLGREHTPESARESFNVLRRAGIRDINIDLMFSIPGQSTDSWRATLDQTISLEPDHISAYNLSYEEDTEFFNALQQGNVTRDTEQDADLFELTHGTLTAAGYRHYETSNFCRNGRTSLHNMAYWLGEDYVGIGPGAFSTIGGRRYANTQDTTEYIAHTLEKGSAPCEVEELNDEDVLLERAALLLRTDTGMPLSLIPPGKMETVNQLSDEGMGSVLETGNFALRGKGLLLVDEIVLELMS